MVTEEDLVTLDGNLLGLVLRFKNCTGNVIDLTKKEPFIDAAELAKAQMAISLDSTYKKSRSRTVRQAVDMVLRWRTIGTGYYDFQIQRYVEPMGFEQAAMFLKLRHWQLTGED